METKRIFLHIGPPKTGSTTIQNLLAVASQALLSQGVLYPSEGRLPLQECFWVKRQEGRVCFAQPMISHQFLAWALMGEIEDLEPCAYWSSVVSEINRTSAHTVIISGESFARLPKAKIIQLMSFLSKFQIKVLFYLRDPFSFLLSWYSHDVKMGRYSKPFSHYIDERNSLLLFQERVLKTWEDCIGTKNIIIKSFEKIQKESNLEYDLIQTIGLNPDLFDEYICNSPLNKSPSPIIVRLICMLNRLENSLNEFPMRNLLFQKIRYRMKREYFEWKIIERLVCNFVDDSLFSEFEHSQCRELTEIWYQSILRKYYF